MNINLTREEKNFLKNIAHELKTQDTRGTAQPYGLTITEEKIKRVCDGCGEETWCYWNGEDYSAAQWEDFVEDVKEYCGDETDCPELKAILKMNSFKDLKDTNAAYELEADVYDIVRERVVNLSSFNFFLTEKAAFKYIEDDHYNLSNPQTYGVYLKKNPEMEKVIELLIKIGEQI